MELVSGDLHPADRVVVRFIWRGVGRGPDLPLEATGVFTARQGRIFGVELFWDHSEAPKAIGLSDWAMSQENVEIVRRTTDAFNRRDLDGIVQDWASDAVVDWSNSRGPDAGIYRGHDEIRGFTQRFLGAWDDVRLEFDDPIEVEEDLLVVENVTYLRGRDGIETQARSAWVLTFRNGQQTSLTLYQTKQEALEAAGLSE
jgi:ketosteroid isomerase-like protein